MKRFTRHLPLLTAVLVAAACADITDPAAPGAIRPEVRAPADPNALMSLTCTASKTTRTVRCGAPVTGGVSRVIIGGQGAYVKLVSSNIQVLADTFAFDVKVTNLIPQPFGTSNGTSADPAGIRVFFNSGPTSTSGGTVVVQNPDGVGTFTASGQPYFQYPGMLVQDSTTAPKQWRLVMTPDVTHFDFQVYISTALQYPNGYVDDLPYVLSLNPGESRALTGTVRSAVGNALSGETIDWVTDAPAMAALSGSQVTAGGTMGFATLTSSSGVRPGLFTTAVSVCQATVVANGTSLPSSIASSDCFSSYRDPSDRPTVDFYAKLYRVTLTAGQTITVTMDSGDDLDTFLVLASPISGFLVARNDDDDEGILGVGSRMIYTATVSGVYVIEASTFNASDEGSYTLGVTIN